MSEKTIETYGKGFLVLLLPISFLIIFLVATWRIWLGVILLLLVFNIWQLYKWQQWCQQANPIFHKLIRENQGRITPMDLAMKGNFPGEKAKRYLDAKATEFGASTVNSEDGSKVYYFITASTLGSILDSSEPLKELAPQPVAQHTLPFLAPPPPQSHLEQQPHLEEPETESQPQPIQESKKTLAQQLVFGSLIQSELAKRLNVYSSTVYKRRDDPDFPEWSRGKDPDGVAWKYSRKTKEFFPVEEESKS
jgi:4-amino-4-deoxy-L-arabinose transferase-like glycosyltransferase